MGGNSSEGTWSFNVREEVHAVKVEVARKDPGSNGRTGEFARKRYDLVGSSGVKLCDDDSLFLAVTVGEELTLVRLPFCAECAGPCCCERCHHMLKAGHCLQCGFRGPCHSVDCPCEECHHHAMRLAEQALLRSMR